jgi:AraC-like DNA-binding protein
MNWIQCLSKSIQYIEDHLTDRISIDEISNQAYTSSSHFQLLFHLVFGMTAGEYIRNRRLTLAALDLLKPGSKIIDVAMRYQYDTQESFSKAFTRFHGFPPSKVQHDKIRMFHPHPAVTHLLQSLTLPSAFFPGPAAGWKTIPLRCISPDR